jgi:ABC-type nitrate/sulfonate/bicarbonate transport system substrate-binding protein
MKRRQLIQAVLGMIAAAACHAQAATPGSAAPERLDVIYFPSASMAAVYVGADRGYYAAAGLDVRLQATPDSPSLISGLANGRFQLAVALADNFVAYQQGQHAAPRVAGRDLSIVMGLATSSALLAARPDVPNVAALRGSTIGVDAPTTGLAFLLYQMLEDAGLTRGDYMLARAGSTQQRSIALGRGEIDATALTPEFARDAQERGLKLLAQSTTKLPSYMGMTLAVEKGWAAQNRAKVESFIAATLAAGQWLAQPENRSAVAAILSRHLQMPQRQADDALTSLLDERTLILDGSIDPAGFDAVLRLRGWYGRPVRPIGAAAEFVDLTYLEAARNRRPAPTAASPDPVPPPSAP